MSELNDRLNSRLSLILSGRNLMLLILSLSFPLIEACHCRCGPMLRRTSVHRFGIRFFGSRRYKNQSHVNVLSELPAKKPRLLRTCSSRSWPSSPPRLRYRECIPCREFSDQASCKGPRCIGELNSRDLAMCQPFLVNCFTPRPTEGILLFLVGL